MVLGKKEHGYVFLITIPIISFADVDAIHRQALQQRAAPDRLGRVVALSVTAVLLGVRRARTAC